MSVRRNDEDYESERRQSLVDKDQADRGGEPEVFTVLERQVITYAWEVRAWTAEEAEEHANNGVPDCARTVRFSSETWTEPAHTNVPDFDLVGGGD